MKQILLLVIALILLLSYPTQASQETQRKTLVLSDVLSKFVPTLIPIKHALANLYADIGVDVEWIEVPTSRALKYSNEGRFDGEFIRAPEIMGNYAQLVQVPTPLFNSDVRFFCVRKIDCKQTTNKDLVVGYNTEIKIYRVVCEQLKLQCLPFYPYDNFLKPLIENKVDVYMATDFEVFSQLGLHTPKLYQSGSIKNVHVYHYLHKDMDYLVPKIDQKLREGLASGEFPDFTNSIRDEFMKSGKIEVVQ